MDLWSGSSEHQPQKCSRDFSEEYKESAFAQGISHLKEKINRDKGSENSL